VIIENIEVKQAEGKEHPYLNWELTIADGEHEGRKLYYMTSLSPKALWNLQQSLQSFSLEDEELEINFDEDTNFVTSPDLAGQAALATVKNTTYEGRVQARVIALDGNEAPKPKKKTKPEPEKVTKTKAKAKPEPEEDEEEEEEEEEEKPAKKSTGKVSPFTKGKAGQRRSFR
jgi:hypothetical protein